MLHHNVYTLFTASDITSPRLQTSCQTALLILFLIQENMLHIYGLVLKDFESNDPVLHCSHGCYVDCDSVHYFVTGLLCLFDFLL